MDDRKQDAASGARGPSRFYSHRASIDAGTLGSKNVREEPSVRDNLLGGKAVLNTAQLNELSQQRAEHHYEQVRAVADGQLISSQQKEIRLAAARRALDKKVAIGRNVEEAGLLCF